MDANQLQEFKDKFDTMLAETTDEELHAFFDKAAEERMSRIVEPYGYRFLNEGEESWVGDLYYEYGDWILYQGPIFVWYRSHGYMMARLKA